jgi:4-hydroxythreonine-4-phosphate dehydrogenase
MQRASLESDVLVCDAENDEDLKAIAEASISLGSGTIWVGSAGLAYQLPQAVRLPSGAPPPLDQLPLSTAPILFVVGSMSTVSRRQAATLERTASVTSIHIPPSILLSGPSHAVWVAASARIHDSLKAGHDTLLVLDANQRADPSEERQLTHALGLMLVPYAKIVGALVATGGETARAILSGWGAASLVLLDEVEPGLPCSFAKLNSRRLPVLTKAGAFGDDDTLISCREFLCSRLRKRDHAAVRKSS